MKHPSRRQEKTLESDPKVLLKEQSTLKVKLPRNRWETRVQLLERLTNPQITLLETSILLEVCTATVRNYCNAGILPHERTPGGQRRFRLKSVLEFYRNRQAGKKK